MLSRKRPLPDLSAVRTDPDTVRTSVQLIAHVASLADADGSVTSPEAVLFLDGLDEQTLTDAVGVVLQLRRAVSTPHVAAQLPLGPWRGPTLPWAPQRAALLADGVLAAGPAAVSAALVDPLSAVTVPDVPLVELLRVGSACDGIAGRLASRLGGRSNRPAGQAIDHIVGAGWAPMSNQAWSVLPPDWDATSWRYDLEHLALRTADVDEKSVERFQVAHPDCSYTRRYPSLLVTGLGQSMQKKHIANDVHRAFWLGHLTTVLDELLVRLISELTGTPLSERSLLSPLPTSWTTAPYADISVATYVVAGARGLTGGKEPLPAAHEPLTAAQALVEVRSSGERSVQVLLPVPARAVGPLEETALALSRLLGAALAGLDDLTIDARRVLAKWAGGDAPGQQALPELVDGVVRLAHSQGVSWVDPPPVSVLTGR